MNQQGFNDLVGLIYDAAAEPELWSSVMERMADAIDGERGWLSQLNLVDGSGGGVVSRIDPAMMEVYASDFATRNPLANVANADTYLRGWRPCILTDEDWMPKEDLLASEYYNDFLKPQDIRSTVMIRLAVRGYDMSAISITRQHGRDQFGTAEIEFLQQLHPHLIRAFSLCQKMSALQTTNGGLAEIIDHSPHGIFLLDDNGKLCHANRNANALMAGDCGLTMRNGRLTVRTPADARRLEAMIEAAGLSDTARGDSMTLCSASRRLPLAINVAPARAERFSVFDGGARVLVCVTDPEARVGVSQRKLRDLFGRRQAEARVAEALFEGLSPAEAAESFSVSLNTVRAQLASIFQKTDTRRQSELVALMTRTVAVELD